MKKVSGSNLTYTDYNRWCIDFVLSIELFMNPIHLYNMYYRILLRNIILFLFLIRIRNYKLHHSINEIISYLLVSVYIFYKTLVFKLS